jgi:glycosyltransferase involved in cell wall biosynthesis
VPRSENTPSDQSGSTATQAAAVGSGQRDRKPDAGSSEQRDRPGVVVGIPAYNEGETVSETVAAARGHADEVVVVDDGSSDQTPHAARESGATLLTHAENQGYGATLGTIFQYAHRRGADHLVVLDADGQHDPEDIPALVSTQRETGAELVTGSRVAGESSPEIPRGRQL